jgi:hypothetical protein
MIGLLQCDVSSNVAWSALSECGVRIPRPHSESADHFTLRLATSSKLVA